MRNRKLRLLSLAQKAILSMAGIAALVGPVGSGVLQPPVLHAQSTVQTNPGQPRPAFEVASVKPIDRATMHRDHEGSFLDGGLFVDRTDLLQYIVRAYVKAGSCTMKAALGVDCPLIRGMLPAWVKTDRWEIQAKLPANSPTSYTVRQLHANDTPQLNLMLQVLLEDRFHLAVHRETKETGVYALTVAKNGPQIKHTPPKGELLTIANGNLVEQHGLAGMVRAPGPAGAPRTRLNFQASSMEDVAATLGWFFDRPVLDRTSLTGDYDFSIDCEEDPDEPGPVALPSLFGGLTGSILSVAIQAVGLKLESTRAPVEVLVIDHVERPKEN